MTDEPRLSLAALAPAVPFIGLGLVLLGVRVVVYGISEAAWPVAVAGVVAVVVGAGTAWSGFRRAARRDTTGDGSDRH